MFINHISRIIKAEYILFSIILIASMLRLWNLSSVPVSLSGDDVDIGYHALSLVKTGKDYTGHFLPLHMNSFSDKKAPLYTYTLVPFVGILGISEFSLRLPSAILGIIGIVIFYLLIIEITKKRPLALLAAFFLAISPWHIQYSRWSEEGVEMLTLFTLGLLFFLKSFKIRYLVLISAIFLGLTIWTYHAAKIFVPIFIVSLIIIYWKEIVNFPRKLLIASAAIFLIIISPIFYDSLLLGGNQRFDSTALTFDSMAEYIIGVSRATDQKATLDNQMFFGIIDFTSKIFHNKYLYLLPAVTNNYLEVFSTQFLFIWGDNNLRHSVLGIGQFYKYQLIFLIFGIIAIALNLLKSDSKKLIICWTLLSPLPSVFTKEGGHHATRLLFLLPPLIIIIALGVNYIWINLKGNYKKIYTTILVVTIALSFIFYQHTYWFHYPYDSERWWHAGHKEVVGYLLSESANYEKIIVSSALEPTLIFFLSYSQYSPEKFQEKSPLKEVNDQYFGKMKVLDNYYFPEIGKGINMYTLSTILPKNTLYMASAKEVDLNLVAEPFRIPKNLQLKKVITYPSGTPAFYFFSL